MNGYDKLVEKFSNFASPGIVPGLVRMNRLMEITGHPENSFEAIHVAGTNGKGSITTMIATVMQKSGYKVALYTSPHLVCFGERLTINGLILPVEVWEKNLDELLNLIHTDDFLKNNMPTFFELVTAVAFMNIRDSKVDVAVIETGLGGRLDATNVLGNVCLSVIASISIDHTSFLGNTLASIAQEKFGIMKHGTYIVYFPDTPELSNLFLKAAEEKGAIPVLVPNVASIKQEKIDLSGTTVSYTYRSKKVTLKNSLIGIHQVYNSAVALTAIRYLQRIFCNVTDQTIIDGAKQIKMQGRLEIVSYNPVVILDGAHNSRAMDVLVSTILTILPETPINIVLAMMKDKDIQSTVSYLRKLNCDVYCTSVPEMGRSADAQTLSEICVASSLNVVGIFSNPEDAIYKAKMNKNPTVICGSLFLVGYVKKYVPVKNMSYKENNVK